MKKKINQNGFTIVELIAVIIVVIVLFGLLIYTHNAIQINKRNDQRVKDIKAIQTNLEQFYSQNGYYPSLKDLNSSLFRANSLKNLNSNILVDPSNSTKGSIVILPAPKPGYFSYTVTDSAGKACENDDTNCAKYTLTATYESKVNGKKYYSRQNID